ncbi:MAG: hypothetical protein Kow00121_50100 [Elainellaceae cyanobacterium]
MDRRISKSYTIWLACTGKKPITFSVHPWAIGLAIGLPIVCIATVIIGFVYQNRQLADRNAQLTEDAADIVQQLETLESTITTLQERAGFSEDAEASESFNDAEFNNAEFDDAEFDDAEPGEEDPNGFEAEDEEFRSLRNFRETEEQLSIAKHLGMPEPQGGVGLTSAAEVLLEVAKTKLPVLYRQLEGEVEPALEGIIVREQAKPKGIPLTAIDTEVTSPFGLRLDPFGWGYEFHQGMDFVAGYGAPIYATAPGVVEKAEWEPGFGNHVILDHGFGYQTLYGHLSEISVKAGDPINRHQVVGALGSTGRSSGPHLHYSVFRNGQAVDPQKYLD